MSATDCVVLQVLGFINTMFRKIFILFVLSSFVFVSGCSLLDRGTEEGSYKFGRRAFPSKFSNDSPQIVASPGHGFTHVG